MKIVKFNENSLNFDPATFIKKHLIGETILGIKIKVVTKDWVMVEDQNGNIGFVDPEVIWNTYKRLVKNAQTEIA